MEDYIIILVSFSYWSKPSILISFVEIFAGSSILRRFVKIRKVLRTMVSVGMKHQHSSEQKSILFFKKSFLSSFLSLAIQEILISSWRSTLSRSLLRSEKKCVSAAKRNTLSRFAWACGEYLTLSVLEPSLSDYLSFFYGSQFWSRGSLEPVG